MQGHAAASVRATCFPDAVSEHRAAAAVLLVQREQRARREHVRVLLQLGEERRKVAAGEVEHQGHQLGGEQNR